jgi:hypothetical protein
MKRFLILIFALAISLTSYGQNTEAQNLTLINVVRNNTLSPARVANALDALNYSKQGILQAYTASGTDTYAVTGPVAITAYASGQIVFVTFTNANTGASTLNINSTGAVALKDNEGNALSAGALIAGGSYIFKHNGTDFWMVGASGGGGAGTPGGADTYVQYNDASAFGGEADMAYNETTNTLTVDVVAVDTEAYDATGWNGDLSVPTKDAVRDKIEDITGTDLIGKVDEETFATLTDGTSVTWDCNNRQLPLGKLTSTQSFTIDMTNVKSGSQGTLKLIKNTASDVTLTFDTSFTNKQLNSTLLTYTFSAASGTEYFLTWIAEGTNIEWIIGDIAAANTTIQVAKVNRTTTQSISDNTYTAVTWTAESYDNASIVDLGTDATKFTIPGSGDKYVTITAQITYAANATGVRRIRIYVNGADTNSEFFVSFPSAGAAASTITRSTFKVIAQGGDYIQVMAYQNSSGSLNLSNAFAFCDVSDL